MWAECYKSNFLNVTQITHSFGVFLTAHLLLAGNSPLRTSARPHSQWCWNSVVPYFYSIGLCKDQIFCSIFSVSTKSLCTIFLYLRFSQSQRELVQNQDFRAKGFNAGMKVLVLSTIKMAVLLSKRTLIHLVTPIFVSVCPYIWTCSSWLSFQDNALSLCNF